MKWVALVLALVNVAVLAWMLRHPERAHAMPPEPIPATAGDNVNRLLLLSEVNPKELHVRRLVTRPAPTTGAGEASSPPASPASTSPAESAPSATATAPSTASTSAAPAAEPTSSSPAAASAGPSATASATPPAEKPAPGPTPATASPPGGATAISGETPPATPPAETAASTPAPPPKICITVGPLETDSEIADVRAFVVAQGGDPMLRVDERREISSYWVYFPPLPSREEANARVEQIKAQGITDVLAIPRGDMANAVSLGLFTRQDTLQRRLRELKAKGFQPSVSPRYRTQKASWLDVHIAPDHKITQAQLAARFPKRELDVIPCAGPQVTAATAPTPASLTPDGPPHRAYKSSGL